MSTLFFSDLNNPVPDIEWSQQKALLQGKVLVETRSWLKRDRTQLGVVLLQHKCTYQ